MLFILITNQNFNIKFFQLMGETYQKGGINANPYARFPYDLDHKLGVITDPFQKLRDYS